MVWSALVAVVVLVGGIQQSDADLLLAEIETLAGVNLPTDEQTQRLADLIQSGRDAYPDDPRFLFWHGDLLDRQYRPLPAVAAWTKILENEAASPRLQARTLVRLGYVDLVAGETDRAVERAGQAIALRPAEEDGYRLLGETVVRTGSVDDYRELVERGYRTHGRESPGLTVMYLDLLSDSGATEELRAEVAKRLAAEPLDGLARHYHARLQDLAGDGLAAAVDDLLVTRSADAPAELRSRSEQRLADAAQGRENERPPGIGLDQWRLANATFMVDRPYTAADAAKLLDAIDPPTDAAVTPLWQLAKTDLLATAAYWSAKPNPLGADAEDAATLERSARLWRSILDERPGDVPALVGLALVREITGAADEAAELFAKARTLDADHPRLRELFRLGADFAAVADGLRLTRVDADSPWHAAGLRFGDTVLSLDDSVLAEMPPRDRLLRGREFRGGRIGFRTAAGRPGRVRMPSVYFDDWR